MFTLTICGDLVPTDTNARWFMDGTPEKAFDADILDVFRKSDEVLINLETPLYNGNSPIPKSGPALRAGTDTAKGLKQLGNPILSLSNNHIMDHGAEGLKSTISTLSGEGIPHLGAGMTPQSAAEPYMIYRDGLKIGIIACAEHEFSVAGFDSPGANPFDPLETPDAIAALRKNCDYVVVLYHGGAECYRYPSPELRRTCRKMAEKGASLIVCQHSHAIGCFEKYEGALIVYGQGNLLFDRKNDEYWHTALIIRATFDDRLHVQYIPVTHADGKALLAKGEEENEILAGFSKRSQEILAPGFVESAFEDHARKALKDMLYALRGKDRLLVRLDRKTGGNRTQRSYTRRRILDTTNLIECEALRELLLAGLKQRING